jgi:LPXTG-site transpeptidase (sortase) family protein
MNKNFQALNGIQNLAWGDTIEVRSAEKVVIYQVEKVYKAKAEEVTVPLEGTGPRLTLATCNSFGAKDDRFIVEAKAIETRTL